MVPNFFGMGVYHIQKKGGRAIPPRLSLSLRSRGLLAKDDEQVYFLLDFEDDKVIADLRNEGTGLLTELKQTLAVTLLDIKTHRATERNMVIYSIGKALTKKYVFGY